MRIVKPPRLRPGDVIGLISPASAPSDPSRVQAGVRYLEGLGYRVRLGAHALARRGYLAGTDTERVADLNAMLNDVAVKAIFALRGGYGTPRLLPQVDYAAARRQPKIIVGHSDLTALQLALHRGAGLVTFSGPMVASDFGAARDPYTEEHFWRLLNSPATVGLMPNPSGQPVTPGPPGRVTGRLLGGNFSLLVSLLGTPFSPTYRGALLVLEDVNEHLHRLDRMFTQLRNAGVLSRVRGLVLGRFTHCTPHDPHEPHLTLEQILDDVLSWAGKPALSGWQYGHVPQKLTIPLGLRARLDADRGAVEVLEAAVT
jgi:muramoyltetrapeptide carboxypeptidase